MNEELKPCPFCGSDQVSVSIGETGVGGDFYYVECEKCAGMCGSSSKQEDAVKAWNKRINE